jgi:multiple sugar transport system substrate-binding protein
MQVKRNLRFVAVVLCSLIIALSAWSSGQQPEKKTEKTGVSSFEGKTVNVLLMAAPMVQKFGELVSDFEARTGAKVNLLIISPKNYDEKADMELLAPSGAYDAVWLPWRTFHRWIKADWFDPLDGFLANRDLVDPDMLKKEGFAQGAYRSLNVDGKQFALPIMSGAAILHYRKDVLAKHGIGAPPDTWLELEEAAKKVHSPEMAGIGMRCSKKPGQVGLIYPMVLAANGGAIVKDYPNDMHPTLDQPVAIETAEYFARVVQNYGFQGVLSSAWQESVVAFQQGRLAFFPDSTAITGQLMDPKKATAIDQTAFALVPKGSQKRVSASAVHGLGVPKNSPNKELGYKFIEWALSEEIQFDNSMKFQVPTLIRPNLMMRREFLDRYNWGGGQFVEVASQTFAKYADPLFRPHTPEWRQVEEIIGIAMSNVLTGQADAKKALTEANKEILKVYQEAGYISK